MARNRPKPMHKLLGSAESLSQLDSQFPFEMVVKQWQENHVSGLAAPTRATYQQNIRCYILPAFKGMRLYDVSTLEIEKLFKSMEQAGLSRATRATCKGVLKSIFGCARRWKYTDAPSPVRDAAIGGGARRLRECRIPSLDDVQRLIAGCRGDIPLLIETLITTGMRISEAAGLKVSDLDFEHGLISVARRYCRGDMGDTKSDHGPRLLGMGSLAEDLRVHVAGKPSTATVFTYNDEPIEDNSLLANHVTPVMEKLGIKFPGFGWHTFRRMHLTMMRQRSLSLFDLRQQVGHADVRTTLRYIADSVEERARAVAAKPFLVKRQDKKSA